VTGSQILAKKGSDLLNFYNGFYVSALLHVYPDIGLKAHKFAAMPRRYWKFEKNRRCFFDAFAKENGFDPLVAGNWYPITGENILANKSSSSVLNHYEGSFIKALTHLYPDIGLDTTKFRVVRGNHWADERNQKEFFDTYAKDNGFDPLVASNWYSVTRQNILKCKGSSTVLTYYQGSFVKALAFLYPDIGLDTTKFSILPKGYWANKSNRKRIFENLAYERGFDVLLAENWYSLSNADFLEAKGANTLVHLYKGSFADALIDLFPDIGLDERKLRLKT